MLINHSELICSTSKLPIYPLPSPPKCYLGHTQLYYQFMKKHLKYLLALPFAVAYLGWGGLAIIHWSRSSFQDFIVHYNNSYIWGAGGWSAFISLWIVYLGPEEPNWAKVLLFASLWVWWVYFLSYTFISIPMHVAYVGTNCYWFWRLWKSDPSTQHDAVLDSHLRPMASEALREKAQHYLKKAEVLGLPYEDVKNTQDLIRLEKWSLVWNEVIGQLYEQKCLIDEDFYFKSKHPPQPVALSKQAQAQLEALRPIPQG